MLLPSGEWYAWPKAGGWISLADLRRLDEAVKDRPSPEAAGLRRVEEWRTMGWPEGAKEAEHHL